MCHHLMEGYRGLDERGADPEDGRIKCLMLKVETQDLAVDGVEPLHGWEVKRKHCKMSLQGKTQRDYSSNRKWPTRACIQALWHVTIQCLLL